eukprot:COSAG02_NODE_2496_length_8683_cov_41.529473_4_plen_172_part_00
MISACRMIVQNLGRWEEKRKESASESLQDCVPNKPSLRFPKPRGIASKVLRGRQLGCLVHVNPGRLFRLIAARWIVLHASVRKAGAHRRHSLVSATKEWRRGLRPGAHPQQHTRHISEGRQFDRISEKFVRAKIRPVVVCVCVRGYVRAPRAAMRVRWLPLRLARGTVSMA